MLKRPIYLLILVFFTKTFVKAGFALPGFSTNPKSLEILKKDKSFRSFVTTKQNPQIFSKRKLKLRGISVSSAEVPFFHFSVINSGIFRIFSFSGQSAVLNSYLLPSRRGPPVC
jgi:hypothetical protein